MRKLTRNGLSVTQLMVRPSADSVQNGKNKISEVLSTRTTSSTCGAMINQLNPIIIGWANYFCIGNSSTIFVRLNNILHTRQFVREKEIS